MDDPRLASMSPEELRRHMRALGYRTQADLANAIGVSRSAVSLWLEGKVGVPRPVAMLLRMAEPPLPRAPMEVPVVEPRAWEPRPKAAAPGGRGGGPRPGRGGFVRFQLSWGQSGGATASRCLSHVCRRGAIERDMIGAIDVSEDSTSIEISDAVAAEFERRVRKPDARDPNVRITREGGPGVPPGNAGARVPRARLSFHDNRPPPADAARAHHIGPRVKRAARRPRPIARPNEA